MMTTKPMTIEEVKFILNCVMICDYRSLYKSAEWILESCLICQKCEEEITFLLQDEPTTIINKPTYYKIKADLNYCHCDRISGSNFSRHLASLQHATHIYNNYQINSSLIRQCIKIASSIGCPRERHIASQDFPDWFKFYSKNIWPERVGYWTTQDNSTPLFRLGK